MLRAIRGLEAIRGLAVTALVFVALAAWVTFTHAPEVDTPGAQGTIVSYLPESDVITGTVLSFAAGLLTLTLTIPQRQRSWTAALLASLVLNTCWSFAGYRVLMPLWPSSLYIVVSDAITFGLAPAAPALLALGYTIRAARQGTQDVEEQGSLDITIEPMGRKRR